MVSESCFWVSKKSGNLSVLVNGNPVNLACILLQEYLFHSLLVIVITRLVNGKVPLKLHLTIPLQPYYNTSIK